MSVLNVVVSRDVGADRLDETICGFFLIDVVSSVGTGSAESNRSDAKVTGRLVQHAVKCERNRIESLIFAARNLMA